MLSLQQTGTRHGHSADTDNRLPTRGGSGPLNVSQKKSLASEYICESKMHETHPFFGELVFFSHEFGHVVCGAVVQIEKKIYKMVGDINTSWEHR